MINPTTAVNPSQESIAALRELPDDDPVVMVNLLKFRQPDGRKRYARYAAVSGREITDRGGRVLYSGRSLADSEWDSVALVYYPRRGAWLDMQESSAYQAAIADRTAGLEKRLLFAFKRGPGQLAGSAQPLDDVRKRSDEEIFVVNLLRYRGTAGARAYSRYGEVAQRLITDLGGRVELLLTAEQALVSDDAWERFVLVRYPSLEALRSMVAGDTWQAAHKAHREPGLAGTIAFPTRQQ